MLMVEGTHERLPDVIRTHVYLENVMSVRMVLLHVMALGAGLIWLGVVIPGILPGSIITLAEIGWPVALGFFVFFLFLELRARFRIARLLEQTTNRQSPPTMPDYPVGE